MASTAMSSGLRQLIERAARTLRYPDGLPGGVALTIGAPGLTDDWWGYVQSGWLATLTGSVQQSALRSLPAVPEGWKRRHLEQAMQWLADQPDLGEVRQAFLSSRKQEIEEAVSCLGYDRPDLSHGETRTILARLLSLYAVALTRGDQQLIDLVRDLRRPLRQLKAEASAAPGDE
ncbi:hypothetical protein ACIP6P_26820 [Streptomyces sp. NPDC088729]|uniref:hypothetical protein n=1 Tax=Streptomyces sp. NPDC088729 TaxID=3365876 RepID=UPI0038059A73